MVAGLCIAHVARPEGLFGQSTYLLVTVGTAVAAWFGTRRMPPPRRFPWRCVAVAVSLSAIGDVIYYLLGLVDGTLTDVSVADGFWLAAYIVLAVGLSSLIVGGHGIRRVDIDGLIDIGSFAVLAVLVVTQFTVVHDLMMRRHLPDVDAGDLEFVSDPRRGLARRRCPGARQPTVARPQRQCSSSAA